MGGGTRVGPRPATHTQKEMPTLAVYQMSNLLSFRIRETTHVFEKNDCLFIIPLLGRFGRQVGWLVLQVAGCFVGWLGGVAGAARIKQGNRLVACAP